MRSSSRIGIVLGLCVPIAFAAPCLLPGPARAQGEVLPGAERPELEPFEEERPPEGLELPPLPPEAPAGPEALAPGLRVLVREFRVEGSSVFSEAELAEATAPWSGREIDSAELLQARDAVTQLYLDAGYLTSGATVLDQDVEEGVVVLRAVEGALESIDVEGAERFRPGYFRTRLRRAARAPLNVFDLERQLQLFQRDPLIERVQARLEPGSRRGLSRLRIAVEESRFYGLALGFANDNSPSVGSYTGEARPYVANLLRYGDVWAGEFEISDGLRQADADFSIPLPPFDTSLGFHFQYAEGDVVEDPFDVLEIESETTTWSLSLRQPLLRTRLHEIAAGVIGEYRRSRTRLLGECFAFVPGTSECVSKVSVLRFLGEWGYATRRNAIAARSTLSLGLHALGSTDRGEGLPDSEYLAWLGQVQWAHRLPDSLLGSEVLARVDAQLSNDALLGIEKFSVGGMRTVRGYRENQLVRDSGVVASVELRVPVWRDARRRPVIQLAPFVDFGRSWNHGAGGEAETLSSVGIGLRASPFRWLFGELYWGHALDDVPKPGDRDLQDEGLHFALTVVPF
jgi:hemolysin activation/secretion protein